MELPPVEELAHMYLVMRTITSCDERTAAEIKANRLKAAYYPVRGLEGVCAAIGAALTARDYLVSTYRNLGDAVAKGASLRAVVAETYGRRTGTSKGKGGSMHIQDLAAGLMVSTGIVGSGLPIAVGLALSCQLDGEGRVTLVTFGDGATSIGAYHEAMNLAALWRLPIVFVCQNNGWAEHTALGDYAPVTDLAARARAYGMPAVAVDGFDPIATWREVLASVQRARSGEGPSFVECRTYRLSGHTVTADVSYMPKDERYQALERDPTPGFRRWLLESGGLAEQALVELDARARATVDDAFEHAIGSDSPGPDELYRDVFEDEGMVLR